MERQKISELIDSFEPGFALPAAFYLDEDVWAADAELLAGLWLQVGHESDIPEPGDVKVVERLGESILLVRGSDREVRGFYNVCRHRGARVCGADAVGLRQLTCPYHAWSYALDGSLKAGRLEATFESFDAETHRLASCPLKVLGGLLFICLKDAPVDFDLVMSPFEAMFDLYGLANAQVIATDTVSVRANWKTVVENTIDTYHVPTIHPNFTKIRTPAFWRAATAAADADADAATAEVEREFNEWLATSPPAPELSGELLRDGPDSEQFRWMMRGPLTPGYLSETIGGAPVAPCMGQFERSDGASVIANVSPLDSVFISPDYATTFSVIPVSQDEMLWQTRWYVAGDAEEGHDFDTDAVKELYREVNAEDFPIWEWTYAGVSSRSYRPGKYAPQELLITEFQKWYMARLRASLAETN